MITRIVRNNKYHIYIFYGFMSIYYLSPLHIYDVKNTYHLITTKKNTNMTHFSIHDRNYHNFICIQAHFGA